MSVENQVGIRYNKLLILEDFLEERAHRVVRKVNCICDCGKTKTILLCALRSGKTKSCGCIGKPVKYEDPEEPAFINLYCKYRTRSNSMGKSFDLDKDTFRVLTKSNCFYCGAEPNQQAKNINRKSVYTYNGIDRLDNSLGYTIDNSVACCKWCNMAKNSLTLEEFRERTGRVYYRFEKELLDQQYSKLETITKYLEEYAKTLGLPLPKV